MSSNLAYHGEDVRESSLVALRQDRRIATALVSLPAVRIANSVSLRFRADLTQNNWAFWSDLGPIRDRLSCRGTTGLLFLVLHLRTPIVSWESSLPAEYRWLPLASLTAVFISGQCASERMTFALIGHWPVLRQTPSF